MRPASLSPPAKKSRKPKLPPIDPAAAKAIHDEWCPNGKSAAAEPDRVETLFVYWGQGKGGKCVNPVYGIRAPSLSAAIDYARSRHRRILRSRSGPTSTARSAAAN